MVKAGRFGEYVTDGEYNATLRKDDSVEAITLERAAELLAERRAKGPAKKAAKRGREEDGRQEDREEDGQEDDARRLRRRSPERRRFQLVNQRNRHLPDVATVAVPFSFAGVSTRRASSAVTAAL